MPEHFGDGHFLASIPEGHLAASDGLVYYLTPCCKASAKGCDGYIGCRSCYTEIDPRSQ